MKKNKIPLLDVDFIGSQEETITVEEAKIIADYFQKKKQKSQKIALAA